MKRKLSCAQTRLMDRMLRAPLYELDLEDLSAAEMRTARSLERLRLACKEMHYFYLSDAGIDAAKAGVTHVEVPA